MVNVHLIPVVIKISVMTKTKDLNVATILMSMNCAQIALNAVRIKNLKNPFQEINISCNTFPI